MSKEKNLNDNNSSSHIENDYIQKELDDLLSNFEENINRKIYIVEEKFNYSISEIEKKILELNEKKDSIIEHTQILKFLDEKLSNLEKKLLKNNDQIIDNEVKLTSLRKDFSEACFKYDKLFINNLSVPGLIGNSCKFKSLKEFVEFSVNKFLEFESCKQKQMACMTSFKDFTEMKFGNIINDVNKFKNFNYDYINEKVNGVKNYIIEQTNIIHEKIPNIKAENTYTFNNILEEVKNLKEEREDLKETKNFFLNELENTFKSIDKKEIETQEKFKVYIKELLKMKKSLSSIIEFIKDVRFKRNINKNEEVTSNQINKLVDELSMNVKKSKLIRNNNKTNILNNNNLNIIKSENESINEEEFPSRIEKKSFSSNHILKYKKKNIETITEDNDNISENDSSCVKSTEKDFNNKSDENTYHTDDKRIINIIEKNEKENNNENKNSENDNESKFDGIKEIKEEILNIKNDFKNESLEKNKFDDINSLSDLSPINNVHSNNIITITDPIQFKKKNDLKLPKLDKKIFHLNTKNKSQNKNSPLIDFPSNVPLFSLKSNSMDLSKKKNQPKMKNNQMKKKNFEKKKKEDAKLIHNLSVKFLKPLRNSLINVPLVNPKNYLTEN